MTAHALRTLASGLRLQAIEAIIRKDMRTLWPYAVAGAIGLFLVSALFHNSKDWHAIDPEVAPSLTYLTFPLMMLLNVVVPVGMAVFVILLAQSDAAADTRRDWLIRPVAPLELVAAKAASIFAAIIAPMFVGSLIYMVTKGVSFAEANVFLGPALTCCVFVLVLSWLVSTPFRAILALLGVSIPLGLIIGLVMAVKMFIVRAKGGPFVDPTPFPGLDQNEVVAVVSLLALIAVSGLTLWLLLVRRRRTAARWLFVSYLLGTMLVQAVLFIPFPPTAQQIESMERPASITSLRNASKAPIRAYREDARQ